MRHMFGKFQDIERLYLWNRPPGEDVSVWGTQRKEQKSSKMLIERRRRGKQRVDVLKMEF